MELQGETANCKLKLSSKRLKSGKVQVKFSMSSTSEGEKHGYILTDPRTSLKDVVNQIVQRFNTSRVWVHHAHLFNIGKTHQRREVILF